MVIFSAPRAALASVALASLVGCGSASPSASSPDRETGARDSSDGVSAGEETREGSDGELPVPASPAALCADGTCAPCGEGLCPGGFYCDESAPSGAACSWLPECAGEASCACVKRVLGGTCEERDSGVYYRGG